MKTGINFKKFFANSALLGLMTLLSAFVSGQTTVYLTSGSGNWVVPCGVTSITVEMWGGGGAGGGSNANNAAGGGASGCYTSTVISGLLPGSSIAYSVGTGGPAGATGAGGSGNPTTFTGATTANGGGGGSAGSGGSGGAGGTNGCSPGAGSNGTAGGSTDGGAGGNATNGGLPGGAGGVGGGTSGTTAVSTGTQFGGGGGGGGKKPNSLGGGGASGGIKITYTVASTAGLGISYSGSPWCMTSGAQSVTLTGDAAYSGGTYSSTAGLSINATTGEITPSTSTPGTYTVTYTPPGCVATYTTSVTIIGPTITLTSGSLSPNVCVNSAMTPIVLTVGGTATSASLTSGSFPTGVSGSFSGSDYTISGTPTVAGSFPYTITTSGGACGTTSISGTITVNTAANAGTVSGSSPLCIGSNTNYTVSGENLAGGTGAWSSSNPAVATVDPVTGVVTGVSAGTCNIIYTITGGCGGTVSSQQSIDVQSCVVYCTPSSGAGCSVNYGNINNVLANTINNSTTSNAAYEDFTGLSTTVIVGQTLSITINATAEVDGGGCNTWASSCLTVFIDWNMDGDFLDANETTILSGGFTGSGQSFSTNITVPGIAVPGNILMRIVLNETNCSDPCVPSGTGQVEDYTIVVAPCTTTTPNAGTDQDLSGTCDDFTNLAGNVITVGTGTWVLISGSGTIDDPLDPNTLVTNLGPGTNVFEWQVANDPCPPLSDQVNIINNDIPTVADAGGDLQTCNGTFAAAGASSPVAGETGAWTCTGGACGSVGGLPSSNPNQVFTLPNTPGTTATLTWTITQTASGCTSTSDMVLTVTTGVTTANAGPDQADVCWSAFADGFTALAANTPAVGSGSWTINSNTTGGSLSSTTDPSALITGINADGAITLTWTISSPGCASSTDQVTITTIECNGDEPCGALSLPVNSGTCSLSTYNNTGMTVSTGMPEPGCQTINGPDIWFAVTVPASGQVQIGSTTSGTFDEMISVYDGPCNALEFNGCVDGAGSDVYPLTYTGSPGSTIYVRVNEGGTGDAATGNFEICAYEATTATVSEVLPGDTTTITCGSTLNFYDPGGQGGTTTTNTSQPPPAGNYSNNTSGQWVICPSDPSQYVQINFNEFTVENGFDKVIILSADTVIAQWTGNEGQGDVVTSINPGECLTVVLQSDYIWTAEGWEAVVSCTNTPVPAQIANACEVRNCNGGCGVWICADGIYDTQAGAGAGIDEVNETTGGCWGAAGEVATSWFYFTVGVDGSLEFEFVPSNNGHNINFALYGPSYDGVPPCPLSTGDAPIRCSFATAGGINTGLQAGQSDLYDIGTGDGMAAPLDVVAGETYALVVDVYQNGQPPTETEIDFTGAAELDCTPVNLPIELLEFYGMNQGDVNVLNWITSSEFNNDYFTIYRSADASYWEEVGVVDGAGTSSLPLYYTLRDEYPYAPITYYKLKQTDFNGSVTFSDIIAVSNNKVEAGVFVTDLFPNPVKNVVNFSFNSNDENTPVQAVIVNDLGQIVKVKLYHNLKKGSTQSILVHDLPEGVYQIEFTQGEQKQTKRFAIIR